MYFGWRLGLYFAFGLLLCRSMGRADVPPHVATPSPTLTPTPTTPFPTPNLIIIIQWLAWHAHLFLRYRPVHSFARVRDLLLRTLVVRAFIYLTGSFAGLRHVRHAPHPPTVFVAFLALSFAAFLFCETCRTQLLVPTGSFSLPRIFARTHTHTLPALHYGSYTAVVVLTATSSFSSSLVPQLLLVPFLPLRTLLLQTIRFFPNPIICIPFHQVLYYHPTKTF